MMALSDALSFDTDFAGPAEWAAMYRARGLQVVPCYMPSEHAQWKRPKLADWLHFQEQLVPDETFERWYGLTGEHARRPNMGLLTGRASGNVFVIDLDEHTKPEARAWWARVLGEHNGGDELDTWHQVTGGGGRQLFFQGPPDWHAPTNRTPIGVDIRGQGGFAVLPPSRHASGQDYAWVEGAAPYDITVEEAPGWLLEEVDRLVAAHGGDKSRNGAPAERTLSPGTDFDSFGGRIDGREDYMTRVVWGAVVDYYRECPIGPPPEIESTARMVEAYEAYERTVKTRLAGTDKRALLDREGRGQTLFAEKWRRAISQWDGKVSEAAKVERERQRQEAPPSDQRPDAEPVSSPTRFPFETVGDLRKLPPAQWLVKGWIPEGSTGIFYGKWAAGKSFIGFDLSLHLAYGMSDWHGVELPGVDTEVLVIAREGHQGFVNRVDAFKKHHGLPEDTDRITFMRASVSFMRDDEFKALCEAVKARQTPYKLILIDTVARVLPGVDMNEQQTVTLFMERCQILAEVTGAAAIGVHHQNKSGGMMGSTYFEANADFVFEVERQGEEDEPLTSGQITCTKMKDGEDRWKRSVAYERVSLSLISDEVSSLVVREIGDPKRKPPAESWLPDTNTCRLILAAIEQAWVSGEPWSIAPNARKLLYAPRAIHQRFSISEKDAAKLIDMWRHGTANLLQVATRDAKNHVVGLQVTGRID